MRQCSDCCNFDSEAGTVLVGCEQKELMPGREGHPHRTTAHSPICPAFQPVGACPEDLED